MGIYHYHLGQLYSKDGMSREASIHYEKAAELIGEALRTRDKWESKSGGRYGTIVAKSCNSLAAVLDCLGRFDDALPYHERSLSLRRADDSVGPVDREHYVAISLNAIATHHFKKARYLCDQGDSRMAIEELSKAADAHKEALTIRERYRNGNAGQFLPRIAASENNLAWCLVCIGDIRLSLSEKMEAPDCHQSEYLRPYELLKDAHDIRMLFMKQNYEMYVRVAVDSAVKLATCLDRLGKHGEAERLREEAKNY